ncbi:MAG: hypothetical protein K2X08_08220 [Chlamydiales bacterium]|nr:hypothetical protein [Chlamydiales bacterium]
MDQIFIMPISETLQKGYSDNFEQPPRQGRQKGIDAKVQGLAHTKMGSGLGSLFVSMATPPSMLRGVRSSIRNAFRLSRQSKCIEQGRLLVELDSVPLGLMPCGTESWMNAVMQIVLHLPIFKTILALWAPQSYEPFQMFIEQYEVDRKAHATISSASSLSLVRCLAQKNSLEAFFLRTDPDLFQIFRAILWSFSSQESAFLRRESVHESCLLMEWDGDGWSLIEQKLAAKAPSYLLVFMKNSPDSVAAKQIPDPKRGGYYELQGFIEKRGDEGCSEFIAYVKVAGKSWYQCRNQRIAKLHSIHLDVPLLSSRFFYYKKT